MNENTKQKLEELKELVLNLHRSAGMLDHLITQIEFNVDGKDIETDNCYIRSQAINRLDWLSMQGLMLEKERNIWLELIDKLEEKD